MGKVFSVSTVIVIFCCCILFGLPYVGVTMAGILVCILVIFIPIAYFSRPQAVKDAQKEVSKCVSEGCGIIAETLEDVSNDIKMEMIRKKDEKNKQVQQELAKLSLDEISIITEKNIYILKYVETKKRLKDAGCEHSTDKILFFMGIKNEKGRKVLDHVSNTAVHIAASADKASAALERQCDHLLSDEEMAEASAKAKAKLAKAKADNVADDYSDIL